MLFSIVTINYNNKEGLAKTIESVLSQTYKNFEFIIIDGASTDGSTELIETHKEHFSFWVSEPDKGIYNAQNKGTSRTSGDYTIFMNSGDVFASDDILSKVAPQLDNFDIVYGDLLIVEEDKSWRKHYNEPLTFLYFLSDTLPHQGSFIRTALLKAGPGGPYDEGLRICADWKFFMDAICKRKATSRYLGFVIAHYDFNGLSSLPENRNKLLQERDSVLKKEYGLFYEGMRSLLDEYRELKNIANSRIVKLYFKFRNLLKK